MYCTIFIIRSLTNDVGNYFITLRTLKYGENGIFLILGNAGFISSAVC